MPFCQACGSSVNAEARFCNACGKPANFIGASSPSIAPANAPAVLPIETMPPPNLELSRTPARAEPGAQSGEEEIRAARPRGVTVLAVLAFIAAVSTVSLGFFLLSYAATARAEGAIPLMQLLMQLFPVLAQGQQEMVSQVSAGAVAMFAMAAICAVTGYGLWTLRKWGLILAIVYSALTLLRATAMILTSSGTLLSHLFSIAIYIWIITYLLKPHVKQAFGA